MYVEILGLFVLGFVLRSALLFKYKWVGTDTFYHLLYGLNFRKKRRIRRLDGVIVKSETKLYPPLFHVLLSIFPKPLHRHLQAMSAAFDMLSMLILLLFTWLLFGSFTALLAGFIYAIAPILILSCFALNPRTLANSLIIAAMIFLFLYFVFGNAFYLIPFLLFSSLILLSHRLTVQSLVAVVLAEVIAFRDLFPLAALAGAFLVAIVMTRGFYVQILRSHVQTLARHFKHGHYRYKTKRPENPIRLFAAFPFMLAIIVYMLNFGFVHHLLFLQIWFFVLLAVSFFWIWGDGYRYLTNAAFPGAILAAAFLPSIPSGILIFTISTICSFAAIGYIVYKFKTSHRVIPEAAIKCFEYVKANARPADTLFVWPLNYWHVGRYFSGVKTFNLPTDTKNIANGALLGKPVKWVVTNNQALFEKTELFKLKYKNANFGVFALKTAKKFSTYKKYR
jgi:hypothetical protein